MKQDLTISSHSEPIKRRNPELDIIKGFCIISICCVHATAGFSTLWFSYFYVAAFFYAAGYTFKIKPFWTFVRTKFFRLYLSFCLANIFGLVLWEIIAKLTDYPHNPRSVLSSVSSILRFNLVFNLMAPAWFLLPLLLTLFIFYILKKCIPNDRVILGITTVLFLYTCKYRDYWMNGCFWNDCAFVTITFIGLFILNLGYLAKKYNTVLESYVQKYGAELFLVSFIVLDTIKNRLSFAFNLREGKWSDELLVLPAMLFGLYFIIYLSKLLSASASFKGLARFLCFTGKHSMAIMFFHIPCFSAATLLIHVIMHEPFPRTWTNSYQGGLYGTLSVICGVLIPLLFSMLIQKIKEKFNF